MNSLSAAGQAQKGYQRLAKSRKKQNDQIFTFQAELTVLTLRHMNSLSAAGQAQRRNDQIFTFQAQVEQFISDWPSPERS